MNFRAKNVTKSFLKCFNLTIILLLYQFFRLNLLENYEFICIFGHFFFWISCRKGQKDKKDLIYSQRKVDFLGAKIQIGIKVISFRT